MGFKDFITKIFSKDGETKPNKIIEVPGKFPPEFPDYSERKKSDSEDEDGDNEFIRELKRLVYTPEEMAENERLEAERKKNDPIDNKDESGEKDDDDDVKERVRGDDDGLVR